MQDLTSLELEVVHSGKSDQETWSIQRGQFDEGASAGVSVVVVSMGDFSFTVLPTRGMGLWYAQLGDLRVGWDSPVKMPVHPGLVNLSSRNGLGWLDGFTELMCRCGLSFNGPPGQDEAGGSPIESEVTLHGKIANLPAHSITFLSGENGEIGVSGIVDEATLFGPQLRLETQITTRQGQPSITVRDRITNRGSDVTDLQLLYHTNFGQPFLAGGSRLRIPATRVVPRDGRAAEDVKEYQTYLPPTQGYTEQAYFFDTIADSEGRTLALLESEDGQQGVSLAFRNDQLPCFTQWKCTQPLQDGYVTGLEPGTNFPNFKAYERRQGRVIQLEAGASYETELTLAVHSNAAQVDNVRQKIANIQGDHSPEIVPKPMAPYCSID